MVKNNEKLKFIILIVVIAIIGCAIFFALQKNKSVNLEEISYDQFQYYILKDNGNFGVIDKDGNKVVDTIYKDVNIPNPTKPVFVVTDNLDGDSVKYWAIDASNNKIFTQYEEVSTIAINPLISNVPYEKSVLKYKENGKYGLIDFDGNKITDAIYEEISNVDYKEGYLKVKKDGFYGIINIKGKKIIACDYDDITSDGYYSEKNKYSKTGYILRVKTDDGYRYGYANYKGKISTDPMYNELDRINDIPEDENIYLISSTAGDYGLIKNGKQIIENQFSDIAYDKSGKVLIVTKNQASGVYDLNGKVIVPIDYETILIGGDYINATKQGTRLVFDKQGNKLDTTFQSSTKVYNDYSIIIDENNYYNIVDGQNNKQLSGDFIYIEYFKNGLFIATKDNKTGVIDANGNIKVSYDYDTIQQIDGTNILEAYKLTDNEIDLIDADGNVIKGLTNAQFIKLDNYIEILSDNGMKYFDFDGKEKSYKELYPNNKIFADCQNGKWGFVDANGNEVISHIYEMVTEQNQNFVGIKKDGKWGVLDTNGNVVVEPTYELSDNNVKFLSKYYQVINNIGNIIYTADTKQQSDTINFTSDQVNDSTTNKNGSDEE